MPKLILKDNTHFHSKGIVNAGERYGTIFMISRKCNKYFFKGESIKQIDKSRYFDIKAHLLGLSNRFKINIFNPLPYIINKKGK